MNNYDLGWTDVNQRNKKFKHIWNTVVAWIICTGAVFLMSINDFNF